MHGEEGLGRRGSEKVLRRCLEHEKRGHSADKGLLSLDGSTWVLWAGHSRDLRLTVSLVQLLVVFCIFPLFKTNQPQTFLKHPLLNSTTVLLL